MKPVEPARRQALVLEAATEDAEAAAFTPRWPLLLNFPDVPLGLQRRCMIDTGPGAPGPVFSGDNCSAVTELQPGPGVLPSPGAGSIEAVRGIRAVAAERSPDGSFAAGAVECSVVRMRLLLTPGSAASAVAATGGGLALLMAPACEASRPVCPLLCTHGLPEAVAAAGDAVAAKGANGDGAAVTALPGR